jgi:SAM-dependent methyltransferase
MQVQHEPSPWVTRFAHLAPDFQPVLDLACGSGRHTRLLVERGLRVTAVDIDLSDIGDLESDGKVTLVKRDLEDGSIWPFGTQTFGAVVVTNYLHRPLLPAIVATVASGGVLIYETFAQGNEAFGKPSNPDYLLKPGELIEAVRGTLQIIAFEHGRQSVPEPMVIQRICAVNSQSLADIA